MEIKEEALTEDEKTRIRGLIRNVFSKMKEHVPVNEDNVLVLLKAHLLIEYYLNHIIILYYPKDGYKISSDEDFSKKVDFIEKINALEDREIQSLRRLNRVRNKLSHELEYKISESDVDYIGFCFGEDYISAKFGDETLNLKNLLMWVLGTLAGNIYTPIAQKIIFLDRQKFKSKTEGVKPILLKPIQKNSIPQN